jgi:hypothetical protein
MYTTDFFITKSEERRPLGRSQHSWNDYIEIGLKEIGCEGADWIYLAQVRVQGQAVVNMIMNLWIP